MCGNGSRLQEKIRGGVGENRTKGQRFSPKLTLSLAKTRSEGSDTATRDCPSGVGIQEGDGGKPAEIRPGQLVRPVCLPLLVCRMIAPTAHGVGIQERDVGELIRPRTRGLLTSPGSAAVVGAQYQEPSIQTCHSFAEMLSVSWAAMVTRTERERK